MGTTTAQRALDLALGLMDETGSSEYNANALLCINRLCGEIYPYSDTYTVATAGTRPVATIIISLADVLTDIDDVLANTVLPYGLASELLLIDGENDKANYCLQRYQELLRQIKTPAAEFTAIEDVYGGIEYGEFSAW